MPTLCQDWTGIEVDPERVGSGPPDQHISRPGEVFTENTTAPLWLPENLSVRFFPNSAGSPIYKAIVEYHHGNYMDEAKEHEAFRLLGVECAKLQVAQLGMGEHVFMGLRQALTEGTSDYSYFSSGYSSALLHLRTHSQQDRR